MRALLNRLSLNLVLGFVLAGLSLTAIVPVARDAIAAWQSLEAARQAATLADANRRIFAADQALRGERGRTLVALSGTTSTTTPEQLSAIRAQFTTNLQAGLTLLAAAGLRDQVGPLEIAARTVEAARARTDAMIARPLAERDPAHTRHVSETGLALLSAFSAVERDLDVRLRHAKPAISPLIDAKRAIWEARINYGLAAIRLATAVAAKRPFTPEILAEDAGQRAAAAQAWALGVEIAASQTAPQLAAAIATVEQRYLAGPGAEQRAMALAAIRSGRVPEIDAAAFSDTEGNAVTMLGSAATAALDEVMAATTQSSEEATTGLVLQCAALGAVLLLMAGGCAIVYYRVSRPIRAMTGAMQRLAAHDLTVTIPHADRQDEIGAMATAVAVFKDGLQRAETAAAAEAEALAARAARTARLEALAAGFEDRAGALIADLSGASVTLNATARDMTGIAADAQSKATAVSEAAADGSAGVQMVAAAAEELAVSIGEISRQVAESAAMAGRAVENARQTDSVVRELASAAERIDSVVSLINGIAGQTNLLALNATIEAARAGEAGKGFAVVASEVKNLATQTGRATEDIGGLIAQIQSATRQAVDAIGGITGTIQEVSGITAGIAAAVEEQGAATAEIARNVQRTAQNTQAVTVNIGGVSDAAGQTRSAADDVGRAADSVDRKTADLSAEVQHFVGAMRAA